MSEFDTLKFDKLSQEYKLVLSFDDPKKYQGQFGESIMYGATINGKEVRFYASKGLHEEIQNLGLKKGDKCVIVKRKPGDFAYFEVNGKSKHTTGTTEPTTVQEVATELSQSDWKDKFDEMYDWYTKNVKEKGGDIPF